LYIGRVVVAPAPEYRPTAAIEAIITTMNMT
jgi:hypothetical protein